MFKFLKIFELIHLKLRKFYNKISEAYVGHVIENRILFIFSYFMITWVFSLGLFYPKIDLDTDSLAYVRNSKSLADAKILNKTFPLNSKERHFNNKLLDLGHYFEIILNVKQANTTRRESNDDLLKPEYNFINETIFEEYNVLFDEMS